MEVDFRVADVSDLRELEGEYDYALDIGCLHSLPEKRRRGYAAGLARLVRPGGRYMLYAWMPKMRRGETVGIAPAEVESLFGPAFAMERKAIGTERDFPTAWYWLRRR
jgi:SAM-dependent methyltransferase